VRFQFLRVVASFLLVLLGGAVSLFSIAVAFGWDRGPLSVVGTTITILGLSLMFGGYWLVRNMDVGPLAAACVKVALGFGGMFLVVGLIAVLILGTITPMPTGYFLAVGCLCIVAFYKFRAYTGDH
jgi:hypothetical protein